MKVVVNGKEAYLAYAINLAELIKQQGVDEESLLVSYNNQLVGKDDWDKVLLKENDQVELLRFVGGG